MAKVPPIHSKKLTNRNVYHDDAACKMLQRIKKENTASGTDNRLKCLYCKDLSG